MHTFRMFLTTIFNYLIVIRVKKIINRELLQHYGLWQELAEKGMINNGITFRKKSKLNWRDLYLNSCLWYNVQNAKMKQSYAYGMRDIKNVHVYKDNLIVVCASGVKYFKIENFKFIKDIHISCLDFEESDQMIVKLTQEGPFKKLSMYGKLCVNEFNCTKENEASHGKVVLYKLEGNSCYIIDVRNMFWLFKWENYKWNLHALARYYGYDDSMCAIHIYHDDVYVMLKWGDILHVDMESMCFEKVFRLDIPQYMMAPNPVMFHTFSAIISVPGEKNFQINLHKGTEHLVLECPDLTCATQHGDILFLGFCDGRVEICIPKNLVKNGAIPELHVNVQHFDKYLKKDPTIIGLNVYEAKDVHHLFITTHSNIYQVLITYPKPKKARKQKVAKADENFNVVKNAEAPAESELFVLKDSSPT